MERKDKKLHIDIDPHMGEKRNPRLWYAGFVNLAIMIFEIIALIWVLRRNGAGILAYYTVISNILILICAALFSLWVVFKSLYMLPRWLIILRYVASCCGMLTFVVVMVVLLPMLAPYGGAKMLFLGPNLFQHLICPVLMAFTFYFLERDRRMTVKELFVGIIPTIIYAVISIVVTLVTPAKSPYPFLRVDVMPWYQSVLWIALVTAIAIFIAQILRGQRQKPKKSPEK